MVGPFAEAAVFLSHFNGLPDPRQRGKVVYSLDEVLFCAARGAGRGGDLCRYCPLRGEEARPVAAFPAFHDGTPSHDHLGDIFATLDAAASSVASSPGSPRWSERRAEVIAIDGKTSRRSGQKTGAKAPIHMVSAFAVRAGCSSRAHACRARPEPP